MSLTFEQALAQEVARDIFYQKDDEAGMLSGASPVKLSKWQWMKINASWKWRSVREWIAVKVLRVDTHQGDDPWEDDE